MPKFTIKLSAKADVFATVEVVAEDEDQAVMKALDPEMASTQDWSHYPGSYIPGTQTNESIECEPGDPLEEGAEEGSSESEESPEGNYI